MKRYIKIKNGLVVKMPKEKSKLIRIVRKCRTDCWKQEVTLRRDRNRCKKREII